MSCSTLPLLTKRIELAERVDANVALTLEQRVRSRLRIRIDDGREVGILLPRGQILKDGDLLASEEGLVVRIVAAPERLSSALCDDPLLLARACYHLGNRHIALQIEPGRLRWLHDHVLDCHGARSRAPGERRGCTLRTRTRCLWSVTPATMTEHRH